MGGRRHRAAEWVLGHVPPGATIGTDPAGSQVPADRYAVHAILHDAAFWAPKVRWKQRLDESAAYSRVRSAILGTEHWTAAHLAAAERARPYRAWFDYVVAQQARRPDVEASSLDADVLVLTTPYHPRLVSQLERRDSAYARRAEFGRVVEEDDASPWHWWLGLAPQFTFVDPPVAIYEKRRRPSG